MVKLGENKQQTINLLVLRAVDLAAKLALVYAKLIWPSILLKPFSQTRHALNTISCRNMAEPHQLWNISVHFTDTTKKNDPLQFDCDDLCGNISVGFLGIIIRYKGNISEPAQLEVILIVHLEIFTSHLFVKKTKTKKLFIPSGSAEGNQVTMGHCKEMYRASTNESASKYWDFTIKVSKILGP